MFIVRRDECIELTLGSCKTLDGAVNLIGGYVGGMKDTLREYCPEAYEDNNYVNDDFYEILDNETGIIYDYGGIEK